MRILMAVVAVLFAPSAHAAFEGQILLGASGEYECDKIKTDAGSSDCGSDDDLESDFGLHAIYTFDIGAIEVGPRVAVQSSEDEDDSDTTFLEVDGGAWARWSMPTGAVDVFAGGGAGLSWGKLANDDSDNELTGVGLHVVVGGGVAYDTGSVELTGGLYNAYHSYELEGEVDSGVGKVDVTVEGAVTSRFMLGLGVRL